MLYQEKAAIAPFKNEDVRNAVLAIAKLADMAPKSSQTAILSTLQVLGRVYSDNAAAFNAVLGQASISAKSRQPSVKVDLMAARANSGVVFEDEECDNCSKSNKSVSAAPKTSRINDEFKRAARSVSAPESPAVDPQPIVERLVVATSTKGPRSVDQIIVDFSNDGQMMKEWAKKEGVSAVKLIKETETQKIAEAISKWETKQAQN